MSYVEWKNERRNPGRRGTISLKRADDDCPRPTLGNILLRFVFGMTIVGLVGAVLMMLFPLTPVNAIIAVGIFSVYIVSSYFVRPEPDTSNMGWLGGLMDNRYRYTDDINRFLFFVWLVLMPGRLVSQAAVDCIHLLRNP